MREEEELLLQVDSLMTTDEEETLHLLSPPDILSNRDMQECYNVFINGFHSESCRFSKKSFYSVLTNNLAFGCSTPVLAKLCRLPWRRVTL